jgi:hypothetical protein
MEKGWYGIERRMPKPKGILQNNGWFSESAIRVSAPACTGFTGNNRGDSERDADRYGYCQIHAPSWWIYHAAQVTRETYVGLNTCSCVELMPMSARPSEDQFGGFVFIFFPVGW